VLDLRGRSPVTEYFVIATGTSPRQMRTVVDEVVDLGGQTGFTAWQQSGYESARWIVLDCVNVVVHVFDTESRDFYDLELLWGDSPRVDWRKELGLPAEYAPPAGRLEEDEEAMEDVLEREDEEGAEAGDADMDEEAEADLPVVTELPDESTGTNSVELVEIDPPSKQGKKGRDVFPTRVEEEEDTTAEERGMGPLSELAEEVESLEEEEVVTKRGGGGRQGERKKVAKGAKKGKKAVKKAGKKSAKKVKKGVKKSVKKVAKKAGKGVKKVAKKRKTSKKK
jgi:ribosome-associated protein